MPTPVTVVNKIRLMLVAKMMTMYKKKIPLNVNANNVNAHIVPVP